MELGFSMYLIIGASSGVGRAIAEEFAFKGHDLVLVSRDGRDLSAVASDLNLRYRVSVKFIELDLSLNQPNFSEIYAQIDLCGDNFEGLLIPMGFVLWEDGLDIEVEDIDRLFRVNCISILKLIVGVLRRVHVDNKISVTGFGSIASVRGRGSNMIYSTSKAAIRFYFDGLRHACAGGGIIVQFYVLGYMDTNLAFGFNLALPKGDPKKFAVEVYRNVKKDFGLRFYPRYWIFISMALKLVPWKLYKKLKF